MSSILNTNSVTSGLILYADMGNSGKSYIGAPTTNLAYNNASAGSLYLAAPYVWINSGTFTENDNETDISPPSIPYAYKLPNNLRIISGLCTISGGIHFGCALTTVAASTTYTISVWFRQNRAGATDPYMRTIVTNSQIGVFYYNGVSGAANWPVNQWIRITATGTTAAGETGVFLSNYLVTAGDKIWYYGQQVEQRSSATALVAGTRTTAQALFDISPTASTFTATGSNLGYYTDHITVPNVNDSYLDITPASNYRMGNSNFTLNTWVKQLDNSANIFAESRGGTPSLCGFFWVANYPGAGQMSVFLNYGGSQYVYASSISTLPYGSIQMLTAVIDRTSSSIFLYLNGLLWNTITGTNTGNISPTAGDLYRIGFDQGGSTTNMEVYSYSHYSRSLSASEVMQNFNALRGRYGL